MATIVKELFDGSKVEILGESYEAGKPSVKGDWQKNFDVRADYVKYVTQAERYWYGEGYGSEKRKNPA